jgi:RNA polymerase sigma factor (sigma-70 family)
MPETVPQLEPSPLPEYDWKEAERKLVFYFSRRGRMDADDLAQETLTRLINWLRQPGNRIEGENGFLKLAYAFGRRVRLEKIKEQSKTTESLPDDLPAAANRTFGLNSQEAKQLVRQLLDPLSEREKALIVAAKDMPHAELAKQIGVPVATVRVWIFRLRRKLSSQLQLTRHVSSGRREISQKLPPYKSCEETSRDVQHETE